MLAHMDAADYSAAADINLAATWAGLGRALGYEIVEEQSMTLATSGLPLAFFNGAYVTGPIADPAQTLSEATDFFASRGVPWLLWARPGVATDLVDLAEAAGMKRGSGPPQMILAPINESPAPPAELSIGIVTDAGGLEQHAEMLRLGFGMPREVTDRLIGPGILRAPGVVVFVGTVDRAPVSCSLLSISGLTAGIYNVATPEAFRGRGYGEALTWAASAEGARRGCTHAALQASPAGYPIYSRMGFTDLGRYIQLEGPANAVSATP